MCGGGASWVGVRGVGWVVGGVEAWVMPWVGGGHGSYLGWVEVRGFMRGGVGWGLIGGWVGQES